MNMDHTLFDLVDLYVYPDITDIIMTYVAQLELLERVEILNEDFQIMVDKFHIIFYSRSDINEHILNRFIFYALQIHDYSNFTIYGDYMVQTPSDSDPELEPEIVYFFEYGEDRLFIG